MITTQYAIHDSWTQRTDIDIVPQAPVNMFRAVHRGTDLSYLAISDESIRRAVSRFDITFTQDRNSVTLMFFSVADALTSVFRFSESSYAALIESALVPLGISNDVMAWPETNAIPRQLADWLGLTYDQLSNITGVSRATFFYWRRPGITPRPESARRVQQLFAVTSLLVKRLGVRGARAWLQSGTPPAWDLLLAGDLAGLEREVRSSMFPYRPLVAIPNSLPLDEVSLPLPPAPSEPDHEPHRAQRRPTRRRLGTE
jgi:hypothetical protein